MTAQPTAARSRQEAVLAALAAGILGPAFDPAVPGRMLELLHRTAGRRDRDRLLGVLAALDTRAGALALTGRPAPLSGRPAAAAEALVRRWAEGRLPPQRRLAAALAPTATRSWPATWSWSARGPAAGWSRPSWPGPAWTWSCSRRAGMRPSATSPTRRARPTATCTCTASP